RHMRVDARSSKYERALFCHDSHANLLVHSLVDGRGWFLRPDDCRRSTLFFRYVLLTGRVASFDEGGKWRFAVRMNTEIVQILRTGCRQVAQQMPVRERRRGVENSLRVVHGKQNPNASVLHDLRCCSG